MQEKKREEGLGKWFNPYLVLVYITVGVSYVSE